MSPRTRILATAVLVDAVRINGNRVHGASPLARVRNRVYLAASDSLEDFDACIVYHAVMSAVRKLRGLNLHRDSHGILDRAARVIAS